MMLAADVPIEAFSIFNALSRGGETMLAESGLTSSFDTGVTTQPNPTAADAAMANTIQRAISGHASAAASGGASSSPDGSDVSSESPETISTSLIPAVAAKPVTTASGELSSDANDAEGEAGDIEIEIGDGVFVIYNTNNGSVRLDTSTPVTTIEIVSESGIFTEDDANHIVSAFDIDTDFKIFKLTEDFTNGAPVGFNSLNFGNVAKPGLSESFVRDDLRIRGSVQPSGSLSNDQVEVEVFATSLSGQRIEQIAFGEEFELTARVRDVRSTTLRSNGNVGVFSAYFDVTWDETLTDPIGVPEFNSAFDTATSGTISDGELDEVGATSSSLSATTDEAQTLFTQRMVATAPGTLQFELDPADELPGHETLVFGSTSSIDPTEIEFDDDFQLTITDSPTAPDLVAFAKAIADSGAIMYGAGWCPHCTDQKELFEDGQEFLPFVEVTNPDKTPNQIARDNNITSYPTWVFSDGSRVEGTMTLQELSDATGIEIPESNKPFIQPIDDVDMFATSTFHVPLDGYDPNGGQLTYSVTSDNPDITPEVLSGNRSLRLDVAGYGKMTFELFDEEAPRATNQITTLAENGTYDGTIFHRILDDFVIQGGDPEGTGFGSSDLPDFDDQFDFDLQHNRTGVLSMAKSQDDTNNSQFFITEGPSRHLDFNHTVFGQLIEGEKNRENISEVPVDDNGKPLQDVTLNSATVFEDLENGLLRLSAPAGTTGSANITVTVMDPQGHEFVESFSVSVSEDIANGGPFLGELPSELSTTATEPVTVQLEAFDIEGDEVMFDGLAQETEELTVEVDENGLATITPVEGFLGTSQVAVNVRQVDQPTTQDPFDIQVIDIHVLPEAPTLDLAAASDSGSSSSDNVTNATSLQFEVTGVSADALVEIVVDDTVIGSQTATDTSVTITTEEIASLGEGTYSIVARQTVDDQTSEDSAPVELTFDTTAPEPITSIAPETTINGELYEYDAESADETVTGVQYTLATSPSGATIDPTTGLIQWTPTSGQIGSNDFRVELTDAAGNATAQEFSVDVESNLLMSVRLQTVDESGSPINAAAVGQPFAVEVYVEDLRGDAGESTGVFAAYVDINFDSNLAETTGEIQYGNDFPNGQFGSISTAGLVDDAGATAGAEPLGAGEFLLISIPMQGTGAGNLQLTTDPADETPLTDSLLNGLNEPLSAEQIDFGATSLELVAQTFAVDDQAELLEDSQAVTIRVLDNDIPVPSSAILTIESASDPSNGTAVVADDNLSIQYTPDTDFQGVDTFTYTMQDDSGTTSTATVTVTVIDVNDPPSATDDTFTVTEDSADNELNVLSNDSIQPDANETLEVLSIGTVANGSATISSDGTSILYTPDADFNGTETISYVVTDQRGGNSSATATITVTEVNDLPIAGDDSQSMQEDSVLTIAVSDLLANDTPGDNEANQTLSVTSVDSASTGTVTLDGDTITFTPAANFAGTATFEYTVEDDGTTNGVSSSESATGTVTVTVNNVNDNPVAVEDIVTARSGIGSITLDVLANDSIDPDVNETLSITDVGSPSEGGTVTINADGQIEYTPAEDFAGTETFTYTISDGNGGSATTTVTANVQNFVPGGISGFVFNDMDDDGVRSSGETALSGVKVNLIGTDDFGQNHDRLVTTNSEGFYQFDELPPGNYTITQIQPTFTTDGAVKVSQLDGAAKAPNISDNSFTVELTPEGIGDAAFNFSERGLEPRFSIWNALASTQKSGLYSSVHTTEGLQWSQVDSGWDGVEIVNIKLNAAHTAVTITIQENGSELSSVVSLRNTSQLNIIGQDGDSYLMRIRGGRSDFDFS